MYMHVTLLAPLLFMFSDAGKIRQIFMCKITRDGRFLNTHGLTRAWPSVAQHGQEERYMYVHTYII